MAESAFFQLVGSIFHAVKYGSGPGPVTPISSVRILNGVGTAPGSNLNQALDVTVLSGAGAGTDHNFRADYDPAGLVFTAGTKLTGIYLKAADANAENVEIKASAANGLLVLKDVTDIATIEPGGEILISFPTTGRLLDATHSSLNFAGTVGGASVRCVLLSV